MASQLCLVWEPLTTGLENLMATIVPHGSLVRLLVDFLTIIVALKSPLPDFQVTKSLPNVTWPLPRNFAGNIAVDRPGHPNNTLFFWAVEKDHGSLTTPAHKDSDRPWGIWLNGGHASRAHCVFHHTDRYFSQSRFLEPSWFLFRGINIFICILLHTDIRSPCRTDLSMLQTTTLYLPTSIAGTSLRITFGSTSLCTSC